MPSLSHGHGYTVDESSSAATARRRGSSSSSSDENMPHLSSSTHIHTHHSNDNDNNENNNNGDDTGNDSSNKNHGGSITSNSSRSITRNSNSCRGRQEKKPSPPLDLKLGIRVKLFFQGLHKSFVASDGPGLQADNGHRVDPSSLHESNYRILPLLIGCIIPVGFFFFLVFHQIYSDKGIEREFCLDCHHLYYCAFACGKCAHDKRLVQPQCYSPSPYLLWRAPSFLRVGVHPHQRTLNHLSVGRDPCVRTIFVFYFCCHRSYCSLPVF